MGFINQLFTIRACERDEFARADFIRFVAKFQSHMFLFVDETAKDQITVQRRHGNLQIRTRSKSSLGYFSGRHRISILGGMEETGMVGSFIIEGPFTSELFLMAFRQSLLPHLGSFSEQEPRSIVVMDNWAIHYNRKLIDCIHKAGAKVQFLPPYSPGLNPIEFIFNYWKYWIIRNFAFCERNPKLPVYKALKDMPPQYAEHCIYSCEY